ARLHRVRLRRGSDQLLPGPEVRPTLPALGYTTPALREWPARELELLRACSGSAATDPVTGNRADDGAERYDRHTREHTGRWRRRLESFLRRCRYGPPVRPACAVPAPPPCVLAGVERLEAPRNG